jgi:hypothetical protein
MTNNKGIQLLRPLFRHMPESSDFASRSILDSSRGDFHFSANVVIYTIMKMIALMIFLLVCPVIAYAQPAISFDSQSYDFGTVPQGKLIEHTFEVSNAGNTELIIQKLVPS